MIFLQLAVLLICIFIGARMSGIGLGVMGMIGCDLLEYFTKNKFHFPVIIITAFDDQFSRGCAKKYGVAVYMRKPVDGEALIDIV